MNYKNTTITTLMLIFVVGIFSFIFAPDKKLKQKITLDKSIKVFNYTNNTKSDTTINIICQLLKVKNVTIIVVPIVNEEEKQMLGYIQKRGGYYLIRVQPNLSEDLLTETYSHELCHLEQYESGRLEKLYYGYKYEEFTYCYETPYFDRKFELDAFALETILKHQVKSLYK